MENKILLLPGYKMLLCVKMKEQNVKLELKQTKYSQVVSNTHLIDVINTCL